MGKTAPSYKPFTFKCDGYFLLSELHAVCAHFLQPFETSSTFVYCDKFHCDTGNMGGMRNLSADVSDNTENTVT